MWNPEEENTIFIYVIMVVEGRVLAVLGIADTVKPEANLTVFTLKKAGLDVILLTGDNKKTAAAIARQAKSFFT